MPSEQVHLSQAEHNRNLIALLCNGEPSYPDWVITSAFYTALHLLEAYFDRHLGYHSTDHKTRDSALGRLSQLKVIYNDYSELKNICWESRYLMLYSKWTPALVQNTLDHLQKIEQTLYSLL